ncbi:MAG: hypothetical protein ABSF56_00605 [Minisyncoccia bacterium]|jgi:hypothetical protein
MEPSSPGRSDRILNRAVVIVVAVFVVGWFLGVKGPVLIANDRCYAILGCNIGFFGYDAALHFVSGVMDASLIVWLMRRFPAIDLFHERFWKNFLIIVSLVAMIAVSWEFGEFCHDQFRMKILHENMTVPNRLDQPTDSDTMGDMTFSILGAALTACALSPLVRKRRSP